MQKLEELFTAALECPPEERSAFLDRACPDDKALRDEVLALISANDEATRFFENLSNDIVSAAPLELESAAQPNLRIGPYRTIQAVGHGGMGAVYSAVRVDGQFDQKVAVKLLHLDMETPELRARFFAERQILAQLSHPNVARLQDGGVTDEGRPYFVMEYVEGVPITQYCQEQELSIEKILLLFLGVIDAVSYLHRNLIVHRDLKPSNIFVGRDGQVKLLDFGIAKLLTDEPGAPAQTRTGEQLLTPEYAAPEQLANAKVTTATDVYALGVVLYELLTGRRPHHRVAGESPSAWHEMPPTPSAVLRARTRRDRAPRKRGTTTSPSRESAPRWKRITGDVDQICLMALHPEPEARYPSAEQFGQDVERYLQGLPVRARATTLGYRTGKFASRHWRGIVAAAVLLAVLTVGFIRERGLRSAAERARLEAQQEAAKAVAVSNFLARLLSSVDPKKAQGREVTVAEVLEQAAGELADGDAFADQPAVESAVRLTLGDTYSALGDYEEARKHLERALDLRSDLDETEPDLLAAQEALGVLSYRQGRYDEADALLRRVLELRTETLGEDHPDTLTALSHFGSVLWIQARYDEVEPLDRRVLASRRRILGEDHPDTLRSLNGLAATLFNRGRYAEAAELFEQALGVQRRQLGESHPDTLTLGNNLAAAYLELGRYPEAEVLLREVLEARRRVLGEENGDTSTSLHNLGLTLARQGRFEEGVSILERAVEIRQKLPGDDQSFLYSRSYLADLYRDQGRLEEAEALYLSTLERQRQELGAQDGATLKTMSGLAELRLRQDQVHEAETLVTDVLAKIPSAAGNDHPDTLGSLTTLARVRNAQGRFDEAIVLSEQVSARARPTLGAEHPLVLEAAIEKTRALHGLGRLEDAADLARSTYESRQRVLGEEHPDTAGALHLALDLEDEMRQPPSPSPGPGS